jgi:DNA-binding transcriptional LysR family regulator
VIASFCQAYPEVEVEIAASEELVDLAAGGFDAGIRLGQFIAGDMVAVRLTSPFPLVVVGSPDYLRRRKRPERIDDLRGHACVRMRRSNGSIAPWPFVDGNKTVEAIVSGPLIAHDYPHSSERRSKAWDLRRCQPRSLEPRLPMADYKRYSLPSPSQRRGFFYITRRQVLPKLRAFMEHVKYRSTETLHDKAIGRRSRKLDGANNSR